MDSIGELEVHELRETQDVNKVLRFFLYVKFFAEFFSSWGHDIVNTIYHKNRRILVKLCEMERNICRDKTSVP